MDVAVIGGTGILGAPVVADLVASGDGDTLNVVSITIDRGRIVALDIVRNPEKLRRVEPPPRDG